MTSSMTEKELNGIRIDVEFVKGMLEAMSYRLEAAELSTLSVDMMATTIKLQISVLDLVLQRIYSFGKDENERNS